MLYEDEAGFWEALRTGVSRSTGEVGSPEWEALDAADAYVFFFGPAEWPRYDSLPDRKTQGVAAYNAEWYRRAAKAQIRGARMYLGRTSALAAERWGVNLANWRKALQAASLASPDTMHKLGARLATRLKNGKKARLTHRNGTALEFDLGRFPIQLDDGLVDASDLKARNNMATMPGGVVGVAIDHTSAEGKVLGNHRVFPNSGPTSGVRWEFEGGHLSGFGHAQGGPAFRKAYRAAPAKGRDRLSYVSIGLNPLLAGCPQMEDQELGAVMLRIGGNAFVGGKNSCPFGSWMVLSGADLSIDGRAVLKGGKIL